MKKNLLTLILTLAAALPASAQWEIGYFDIRAGYRGSLGTQCYGIALNGAYIGTNFCFDDLMGPVDLGIGVNFAQLYNSKVASVYPGISDTASMVVREMEFPLFLRTRINVGNSEMYFKFGPTFYCGLTMDARERDNWHSTDKRYDFYSNGEWWRYRRFDVMLDAGLGFIFGERFGIQLAFAWGCLPRCTQDYVLDKTTGGDGQQYKPVPEGDPKSHNMQLNVGLSYAFK